MRFSYLFLTLLTLTAFIGCKQCEECEDLYYEPVVKVVFYKYLNKETTATNKDTLAVNIKSFNGLTDVNFITNQNRASYYFPIPMDTTIKSTVYKIEYQDVVRNSVIVDSFALKYNLVPEFVDDRLLLVPLNIEIISYVENDTIDDKIFCNNCSNASAQINIYE